MKSISFLMFLSLLSLVTKGQELKDRDLVYNVINDFQRDFNEGSFSNANSYSTADWEHINPNGGITKGREHVLEEVRAVHKLFLKGVKMKIGSIDIRFLTPTVAIADVIHLMDDYTTPDNKIHLQEKQIKTYIVVKREDKWLLTHDQNTIIAK